MKKRNFIHTGVYNPGEKINPWKENAVEDHHQMEKLYLFIKAIPTMSQGSRM